MRPAAEVDKITLLIGADRFIIRNLGQYFQLVVLFHIGENLHCFGLAQLFALILQAGFAQLFHPLFDLHKVVLREGSFLVKIVVKALLDGGADCHLHLGEKLLDRLRHQVSRAVPINFLADIALKGVEHHRCIVVYHVIHIHKLAFHFCADGGVGKTLGNVLSYLVDGYRIFIFSVRTIR